MKKIIASLLTLSIIISMLFTVPSFAAEAYTDTSGWTITTESIMGSFNDITKAIDGDINTYWHSRYYVEDGKVTGHDNPPYEIVIEFPSALEISGVRYVPRQKNNVDSTAGIWETAEIYGSVDGIDFKLLRTATYNVTQSRDIADRAIEKGNYKAMKIVVTAANNGYCTAAEIIMLKGDVKDGEASASGKEEVKTEEKPSETVAESITVKGNAVEPQGDDGTYLTGKGSWDVTVSSSKVKTDPYVRRPIDNDMEQIWHTDYTNEGSTITSKINPPHYIDITFPEARTFSGLVYVNRPSGTAGNPVKYLIYASSDDSDNWVFVESGTAEVGVAKFETLFSSNIIAKKVRFKIVESKESYGSCAEIELLVPNSGKETVNLKDYKSLTKEEFEVAKEPEKKEPASMGATNAADVQGDNGTYLTGKGAWGLKISSSKVKSDAYMRRPIDGDYKQYWHSDYQNEGSTIVSRELPPHNIDITFPEVREFSGVEFTTRPDGEAGNPTKYEIYATTDDSENWIFLEEGVADEDNGKKMKVFAANIKAKRIRYSIVDGVGGYGSCAEIDFYVPDANKKTVTPSEYGEIYDEIAVYEIPKTNMVATSNHGFWLNHEPSGVFDGAMTGFWQTATGEKGPYILTIDMGKEWSIDSFDVSPRQSTDFHGNWDLFNVWISLDGENYELALENHSFERSTKVKNVKFDQPVKARYVEFEIVNGYTNKASCAELTFYQSSSDYKETTANNYEKYILKIGSPVIEVTRGSETKNVTLDVAPFIDDGYTLIPLRGLLEEMGANIGWEGKNQSITVENEAMKIEFQIWNNLVYVTGGRYGRVRYTLNQEPRIVDSRTFIPLRFVSEHLGYTVAWDGTTQTITIEKK